MSIVTLNDRAVRSVTAFGSLNTGSMVFIKKLTASSSGTLDFVDGSSDVVLDSTYKEYLFTFNNLHPANNGVELEFQGNAAGGSGYNETITSTCFEAEHYENDFATGLTYLANGDQAQGTAFQRITDSIGNANDASAVGSLYIFNPSSSTYVKHFMCRIASYRYNDQIQDAFIAGHFNTTSVIDAVQFKMSSGNIDSGTIEMYGIN